MRFFHQKRDWTIEAAEQEDLPVLAEIHGAGFARGWSDGDFHKFLANDNYICLVARQHAKPASGFLLVRTALDEAEIITIATMPRYREKGIAGMLVEAMVRKLQHERIKQLFLEVDESNLPALALYRKLGFRKVADRKGYYPGTAGIPDSKPSTALVMQKELG